MKCAICRNGRTEKGSTTVTLEQGHTTLVFQHVPAEICNNCGEEYLSAEVNRVLLGHARKETAKGVTLEVLRYAA